MLRQEFQVDGEPYYNVIASFGPATRQKLVVGAHYDTALDYHRMAEEVQGVLYAIDRLAR